MYVALVLIFGGLSLLVAVPLGALVARLFVDFLGELLNLNITDYSTPTSVIVLELAIGLIAPVMAAAQPILSNTRHRARDDQRLWDGNATRNAELHKTFNRECSCSCANYCVCRIRRCYRCAIPFGAKAD